MKHGKAFLLFMLLAVTTMSAQQVTTSAGRSMNSSSGGLSFTLGEPAIITHQGNTTLLTQGFHQPETDCELFKESAGLEAESGEGLNGQFSIRAWPNPASNFLNIETQGIEGDLVFEIIDMRGKPILATIPQDASQSLQISLDGIPAQPLFLEVRTKANHRIKTIKFLKINY